MEFKDSGMKYKNRVKSRVMNLRDKCNPALKQNVLNGSITPHRFAVMKPDVSFICMIFKTEILSYVLTNENVS